MWVEWSGRRWQSFYHSLRPSFDSEDDSVSNAKILELFRQIVYVNPGKNDDDTDNSGKWDRRICFKSTLLEHIIDGTKFCYWSAEIKRMLFSGFVLCMIQKQM